ncbi:Cyclin-dependent kinase-like 4 [Apiospora phragmitis]|uniref:Cyclin-dependent kinase-like 4 n=1 Tax=Apiospora phragmitis TaxID=2905665 RepID=A0ABR1X7E2_9PEZI
MSDQRPFGMALPSPSVFVENPDGVRRSENDCDYLGRPLTPSNASNAGSSEGESSRTSINTVSDLGLHAAPTLLSERRCKCKPQGIGEPHMPQHQYINVFIQNGCWDKDLPITIPHDTSGDAIFTDWDCNDLILFKAYQQYFFVPFFDFTSDTLPSYNFHQDTAMPWQECQRIEHGGAPQLFAVKEIFSGDRETYKKELSALEMTFGKMHGDDHLVKLLFTFQQGEKFFLVFECADGNLQEFWESESWQQHTGNDQWAYEQCFGIATALKKIHGMSTWQKQKRGGLSDRDAVEEREFGRHGDIKARNILWFKKYGDKRNHMVLSDLGLTRYHSSLTRSQVRYTDLDGLTRQYGPPEMDLGECISQGYDIWSLGCVYLEFCIWYLEGPVGIDKFEEILESETSPPPTTNFREPTYFNIKVGRDGKRKATVKPVIRKTVRRLQGLPDCTPFAKKMLLLIERRMLKAMPKQRIPIDKLCRELSMVKDSLPKTGGAEHTTGELVQHTRGEWSGDGTPLSRPLSLISGELPAEAARPGPEALEVITHIDSLIAPRVPGSSLPSSVSPARAETGREATTSQPPSDQSTQGKRSRRRGRRHQ